MASNRSKFNFFVTNTKWGGVRGGVGKRPDFFRFFSEPFSKTEFVKTFTGAVAEACLRSCTNLLLVEVHMAGSTWSVCGGNLGKKQLSIFNQIYSKLKQYHLIAAGILLTGLSLIISHPYVGYLV